MGYQLQIKTHTYLRNSGRRLGHTQIIRRGINVPFFIPEMHLSRQNRGAGAGKCRGHVCTQDARESNETYRVKRDLQMPRNVCTQGTRESKETCCQDERDLQKRPIKETYKCRGHVCTQGTHSGLFV